MAGTRRHLERKGSRPFARKPLPILSRTSSGGGLPLSDDDPDLARSAAGDNDHGSSSSSRLVRKRSGSMTDVDVIANEDSRVVPERSLRRHLTLLDLILMGVGGTIGSGLYVLAGLVAHSYAGPATVVSWAVSGIAACVSGCCYAELAARIPLSGSAYAYAHVSFGELPALLAAVCLSMVYVVASAAVARSWGDKCVALISLEFAHPGDDDDDGEARHHWIQSFLDPGHSLSPLGFVISSACVLLLLNGVKESKRVTNVFTALKIFVSAFMVIVGFIYVRPSNWKPFVPVQLGVAGIFQGATRTFFGFLGYDQVCCLAGESLRPKRDLPIAIIATLFSVAVLYMTASLVLTGMQPWQEISAVSGFPIAFYSNGASVAAEITALGEIVTLPIVIMVAIQAQPRLQFALASDGLLPPMFGEINEHGNLWKGTLIAGSLMVLIATAFPFDRLNDMISCAVLLALSITDSSLILLRHEAPEPESGLLEGLVIAFNAAALVAGVALAHFTKSSVGVAVAIASGACMLLIVYGICTRCPQCQVFGGHRHHYHQEHLRTEDGYFKTPLVPFWPCFGIFVNWYLLAQLDLTGILGLLGLLALTVAYYFCYTSSSCFIHYDDDDGDDDDDDGDNNNNRALSSDAAQSAENSEVKVDPGSSPLADERTSLL